MRTHTKVTEIERIDRALTPGIARVRLTDGRTVRMHKALAEFLLASAGKTTSGQVAYSVDDAGNCYNPRVATDADRAVAVTGSDR